jgi:hypothetical protein
VICRWTLTISMSAQTMIVASSPSHPSVSFLTSSRIFSAISTAGSRAFGSSAISPAFAPTASSGAASLAATALVTSMSASSTLTAWSSSA